MKLRNIINLIKYHYERNENGFKNEVYEIATDLDKNGKDQISRYLMSLNLNIGTFVPQSQENTSDFLEKIKFDNESLWLPDCIANDLLGIANAVSHKVGINKFIFTGKPGTGKTEASKQLARILNRELYSVDFNALIDSKLGETPKNISKLFEEINNFSNPENAIILFDEIDMLAIDRTNSNDIREMGRATSTLLKELDGVGDNVVIIATTNLYERFDKALKRRFEFAVNFDRYSKSDIVIVAENILNTSLAKFEIKSKEKKLINKIFYLIEDKYTPGELKNVIRTAVAFSNMDDENDYLRRLYVAITKHNIEDINSLSKEGFTTREIEILTNIPKSTISRNLNKNE